MYTSVEYKTKHIVGDNAESLERVLNEQTKGGIKGGWKLILIVHDTLVFERKIVLEEQDAD